METPSSPWVILEWGRGEIGEMSYIPPLAYFTPQRIQGRLTALLVVDAYLNEYEWNVYVHSSDVTASVHSLYRIKRTELRTFLSYNIAPKTDLSSL